MSEQDFNKLSNDDLIQLKGTIESEIGHYENEQTALKILNLVGL